jgi:hypothetical protein
VSDNALGAELRDALAGAISDVVGEHEGGMATRFVLLLETVGADGNLGLWTFTSEGMRPYETLGMLAYGMQVEQARQTFQTFTERMEDE